MKTVADLGLGVSLIPSFPISTSKDIGGRKVAHLQLKVWVSIAAQVKRIRTFAFPRSAPNSAGESPP